MCSSLVGIHILSLATPVMKMRTMYSSFRSMFSDDSWPLIKGLSWKRKVQFAILADRCLTRHGFLSTIPIPQTSLAMYTSLSFKYRICSLGSHPLSLNARVYDPLQTETRRSSHAKPCTHSQTLDVIVSPTLWEHLH